jgi:hypothetical protein
LNTREYPQNKNEGMNGYISNASIFARPASHFVGPLPPHSTTFKWPTIRQKALFAGPSPTFARPPLPLQQDQRGVQNALLRLPSGQFGIKGLTLAWKISISPK